MQGTFEVTEQDSKKRLDIVFQEHYPDFSRAHIKNMIANGEIMVNGCRTKAGASLKVGQIVQFSCEQVKELNAAPEEIAFDVVYEDGDLLVINKPQGLVVHPCSSTKSGTLVNGLLFKVKDLSGINGVLRPGIVHRLDKNTSGLMLVAKNDAAHASLAKQIQDKTCQRKYLALLEGNLSDNQGHIETYIDRDKKDRTKMAVSTSGKLAVTDYQVIQRFTTACLVEFQLQTGRTHQIRVHAKALGHPVIGDDVYGKTNKMLQGQLLHSYFISFVHPRTAKRMQFEIGLPDYFQSFLQNLKEYPL